LSVFIEDYRTKHEISSNSRFDTETFNHENIPFSLALPFLVLGSLLSLSKFAEDPGREPVGIYYHFPEILTWLNYIRHMAVFSIECGHGKISQVLMIPKV